MRPILLLWLLAFGVVASAQDEAAKPIGDESDVFDGPTVAEDGVSINPRLLANVHDRTFGLSWEEREPYFRILQHARTIDLVKQRQAARNMLLHRRQANAKYRERPESEFPVFVDLFKHPEVYRGRPVTLYGHVRRLIEMPRGREPYPYDIPTLYEAWLYTDDSQGNPAVVVFTEKPRGLPEGGDLAEQVAVTGYFYKMYAYNAQDATRIAPMLLARGVTWHATPSGWGPMPAWVYAVVTLAVVLTVGVLWWTGRRDRRRLRMRLEEAAPLVIPPPDNTAHDSSLVPPAD